MASCLDEVDSSDQTFADLQTRVDSFDNRSCPRDFCNSKQELGEAGFYYVGNKKVTCYSCRQTQRWIDGISVVDIICQHGISCKCEYLEQTQTYLPLSTSNKEEAFTTESQMGETGELQLHVFENETLRQHQNGQRPLENDKYGVACTEDPVAPATSKVNDNKYGVACVADDPVAPTMSKVNDEMQCANSDDYLITENQRLRRECCCNLCSENLKENLLRPCNHQLCSTCFTAALKKCPVCRAVVSDYIPFILMKNF